ncbi:energy-coupling factor transporter ATP-binding protein EcfA2 [Pseudarthrobacter oxydans]|uniref:ATP-dependent DNA helicase n=1 Tax=Pseudarthrobacter oxydans TaxID=1671 RepID=UPI0027830888|nr:AAA family ATPase [Pseudarthrobacter oxydans]MDP9984568.1 energy-coupling factor transporter ATP-binding protein EcfA2 [Pseudarthrobacter oxydans]
MATIEQQVQSASEAIDRNILTFTDDRRFLSQNVLQYLRDLVEGMIVWMHLRDPSGQFNYQTQFDPARDAAKANAAYRVLTRFHALLQISVSHYTLGGDPSERLMLKYYAFLLRTRDLARDQLGIAILQDLEQFPIDQDPSLREYYERIAERIETPIRSSPGKRERYYIHGTRSFFVGGKIYYEVTFSLAHNRTSKFDRVIGFTNIEMTDQYAAYLMIANDAINVLGQTMPILIIDEWSVSIRPCEFDNFARILNQSIRVQSSHAEYRNLMEYLTTTKVNLLDLIDLPDVEYNRIRTWALANAQRTPLIFPALDVARQLIRANRSGSRILRYLLLQMNNTILKSQFDPEECRWLSNLRASNRSSPFDTMPFCTSPVGHNPRFADLAQCFDASTRKHELLARRVRNNVEQRGVIYTPEAELEELGDVDALIARHNRLLPPTPRHAPRRLAHANGHVFIEGYEDDTVSIITRLQEVASGGVEDYAEDVQGWLDANATLPDGDPHKVDDPLKATALKGLFAHSKVALVYGAAGTGKSKMVNHLANYFEDEQKLFLAHTNPAVDNLQSRVEAPNASFSTIAKHVNGGWTRSSHYGLVVIDESSTVSNASLLKVLDTTSFDLLVLVGDVYQIESIEFGNWFGIIRSYLPEESVFELTDPYRTTDQNLLTFWNRVRSLDDSIEESIAKNGYSTTLGASLFERRSADEIVLCLNYDGLYGINNVNRFLQASNPKPAVAWSEAVYKAGDPILFNDSDRFRGVIFNNMKGSLTKIDRAPGRITFDVDLHHEVSDADLRWTELRKVGDTIVQFDVFERGNTDEDDDTANTIVPFQVAYAVSIHKAQGLEYDSVKVVITDSNEERISHSIFYTAITRARQRLEVFWTPETQKRVLDRFEVRENVKDELLLRARRGVQPVAKRPRRQKARQAP